MVLYYLLDIHHLDLVNWLYKNVTRILGRLGRMGVLCTGIWVNIRGTQVYQYKVCRAHQYRYRYRRIHARQRNANLLSAVMHSMRCCANLSRLYFTSKLYAKKTFHYQDELIICRINNSADVQKYNQ